MKKKKVTALIMAGIMSVSLLTGCGGDGAKASIAEFDKNLIYKATYYNKPEELDYLGNIQTGMDGRIYAQGYSQKESAEITVQINPDTGQAEKIVKSSQDQMKDSWMTAFLADRDGNFWKVMSTYIYNEQEPEKSRNACSLVKTAPDGTELLNKELDIKEESFYFDKILMDPSGNLILGGSIGILGYDQEGNQLFKVETETYIDRLLLDGAGNIITVSYSEDYTSRIFSKLDMASKQLVEVQRMEAAAGMCQIISGKDGLYLNDGIFLYSYNLETNEKTKVLNWINSDINGDSTYDVQALLDGRFVGTSYNELLQQNQLMIVEKVQPEDVKDKKLVSLAMPYNDYNINVAVIAFNRQNEEYRIVVDNYSRYATAENYNAGADKMNTDLIAGKIPDLIAIGSLPIGNYTNKGLLADLYEKMDTDSEFNRSDYMENIFKAYEKDGKLYSIVPSFSVQTVLAAEDNVGKTPGWTMEDLEKLMASKPEGTKAFTGMTQEYILRMAMTLAGSQYINYSEGSCSFDSEAFIKFLEFAKQFPEEYEDYEHMPREAAVDTGAVLPEEEGSPYAKDRVLLEICYLYSYGQIHDEKYYNFGGRDITFIGFPAADKQGSSITGSMELAISSKAVYPDGAWAFIKYLLGDEYQGSKQYEWPLKKSMYPALKEKAQKPDSYIDENGKEQFYENTAIIDGKEVKIGKVTDEEVRKVDEFLGSLTQVTRNNEKVWEIIKEESGAFFSGQKSAEEVAGLIQNRVQTYLSESN